MIDRIRGLFGWAGSSGNLVLGAVLVIVAGTWGFIKLADEVVEGETQAFDERVMTQLRAPNPDAGKPAADVVPLGPRWLQEAGRDVTGLGGVAVLTLMVSAVAGYLLLVRKYHAMWLVLVSTTGALVISVLLKNAFDRPRPGGPHFSYVYTSSFPSGHSMLSAAVYLTLGSLLTRLVPGRLAKFYFLAVAILLTGAVGVSRVYMGVHYPTDVLAGWTAGLVWALLCYVVARYLQRRRVIEADEPQGFPVIVDAPAGDAAARAGTDAVPPAGAA
ncbi:MAG TPA: phosphatase PAP2 family protein [Humisphaera sp.]